MHQDMYVRFYWSNIITMSAKRKQVGKDLDKCQSEGAFPSVLMQHFQFVHKLTCIMQRKPSELIMKYMKHATQTSKESSTPLRRWNIDSRFPSPAYCLYFFPLFDLIGSLLIATFHCALFCGGLTAFDWSISPNSNTAAPPVHRSLYTCWCFHLPEPESHS